MRKIYLLLLMVLWTALAQAQVNVTATAGTTGPTVYTSLSAAFTAINAGTHQGAVTITITGNTTEPNTPVPLLASIAPASYTAISIIPSGGSWTITAPSLDDSRGIVELIGADNITIDGDPAATGTRQLSFIVGNTSTTNRSAVIRICSGDGTTVPATDGATNVTVKNCNITGGRSDAASTIQSFGIVSTQYSAIALLSLTATSCTNTLVQNNNITRCLSGIYIYANASSYATGLIIRANTLGAAIASDNIGGSAITIQNTAAAGATLATGAALIEKNDIRAGDISPSGAGIAATAVRGISAAQGNTGITIRKNYIHDIYQPLGATNTSAAGIVISSGLAGVTIENNFIRDIVGSRFTNTLTATNATYGINISAAATGLNINYNTIALQTPNTTGTLTDYFTTCVNLGNASTTVAGFQNNILLNNNASPNAFCIRATAAANISGVFNNNDYIAPSGNTGTIAGTTYIQLSAWQAITAKEAASVSIAPVFVSATDLHLSPFFTGLDGKGTPIAGTTDDIDGDTRNPATPDIGADEYTAAAPPVTTNGGSGLAINYPSLATAINALNAAAITSPVIITLTGNETAPAGGYNITAQGTATNTIAIQGNGSTITASAAQTAGSLTDAIFKITGGHYITLQRFTLQENPANTITAAATNNMTEWGIALLYATTTNGAQNNTIKNNTITLNRAYQNSFGIYSNTMHSATDITTAAITAASGDNSNLKIYANNISKVNTGIAVIGSSAFPGAGLDIGGSSIATADTLTDFGTTNLFSAYPGVDAGVNGILATNQPGANIAYNLISSSNGGVTAGTLRAIYTAANGAIAYPATPTTTTITNNNISLRTGLAAGAIEAIRNDAGENAYTNLAITNNDFNNFANTAASPTGPITFILNNAATLTQTINTNTFTALSLNTTGAVTLISNSVSVPATGTQTINGNTIITSFTRTAVGTTTCILSGTTALSVAGATINWSNNSFSNVILTGASTFIGMQNQDGGATVPSVNKIFSGNTFNNITGTNGGSLTGIFVTRGSNGSAGNQITSNTITNLNGGGSITAITVTASAGNVTTLTSNTINNLVSSNGAVTGITCQATTSYISRNIINTLAGATTSTVNGMSLAGTTVSIFKNKIYDIVNNGGTTASVNGINASLATTPTANIYNNYIGDLRAPASTSLSAITGINVTGTAATYNIYYNTIYINAISSSTTTFGSSGISYNAIITNLDLRNNIIVNLSTPAQEALNIATNGIIAALRRSAGTTGTVPTNYAATSNNNLFYVNPTAGTNNHLSYAEGTTVITNPLNTLANMQAFMANRDQASIEENPIFLSTTGASPDYLHINPAAPTLIESHGAPITGITDDYDGDLRSTTTPDIGADEFTSTVCTSLLGGAAVATPAGPFCGSAAAVIKATGQSSGSGVTFLWQSASDAAFSTPVNIGTPSTTYTDLSTGTITATTWYRLKIACTYGSATAFSNTVAITVNPAPNAGAITGISPLCTATTANYTTSGATGGTWSSDNTAVATVNATTGTVTAIAAGAANITYTITQGTCTATAQKAITVNAAPNAGAVTGITPLCAGTTATFTSNGVAGGQWSSTNTTAATINAGTGLVTAAAAGTTTISYTVTASGCSSSAALALTVNPIPDAGTISGPPKLQVGTSGSYSTNGNAGGTWSSADPTVATISSTGQLAALKIGTTNITYTAASPGCTSAVTQAAITIFAATLTNIYPNPVTDNVNIMIQSPGRQYVTITMMDMSGKLLYTATGNVRDGLNTRTINVGHFAGGLYMVRIINQSGETLFTGRFMKK